MSIQSETDTPEEVDVEVLERFKEVLAKLPSLQFAAELTGNSTQQIAKWREGRARLPFKQASILTRAAGLTMDWLAYGRDAGVTMIQSMASHDEDLENVAFVSLLDVIASAGPGVENTKPYEIDQLPFPRSWLQRLGLPEQHARFINSRGDSMEPTIPDGAICLVDTRFENARKDGIYVLIDGSNVRIKRIALGWQNAIVLISDNERYASETLAAPDAEALRIAGKVVWAGGEL